ncbi:hypothetical protein BD769DRAFT_1674949 [Suillus cothurnatus]|nr:hypothetical protein BD769DRAFT_1674949 [Suillus cothurnatus]
MAHIMPIGTLNSYDPSNQHTEVTDVQIISASDLIDSAQTNPPLHEECSFGHNVFVHGHAGYDFGDEPTLYINLERDAVKFTKDDIEISVDIDSIIWTTKVFQCRGSVGIYVTPPFQTKPRIFKHNHVYVDITISQLEEDANVPDRRVEWLSKGFQCLPFPMPVLGVYPLLL